MPVGTPTLLGHAAASGSATVSVNISDAVASDEILAVLVGGFVFSATISMTTQSGWVNATTSPVTSGNIKGYLYLCAPGALASSTTVTATRSTGTVDMLMTVLKYPGVDISGGLAAAIRAFNTGSGSGTGWATGSIAANSGDAIIGGSWGDGALRTSTPSGTAVERDDFNSATTNESVTFVDKLSATGSETLAGTWSGTFSHVSLGVALIPAAGGGGGTTVKQLAALGVG